MFIFSQRSKSYSKLVTSGLLVFLVTACSSALDGTKVSGGTTSSFTGTNGNTNTSTGGVNIPTGGKITWGTSTQYVTGVTNTVVYGLDNAGYATPYCFDNNQTYLGKKCQTAHPSIYGASGFGQVPVVIQGVEIYFSMQGYDDINPATGQRYYNELRASMTTRELAFDRYTGQMVLSNPYTKTLGAGACDLNSGTAVGFDADGTRSLLTGLSIATEAGYKMESNGSGGYVTTYRNAKAYIVKVKHRALQAFANQDTMSPDGVSRTFDFFPVLFSSAGAVDPKSMTFGTYERPQAPPDVPGGTDRVYQLVMSTNSGDVARSGSHVITKICIDTGSRGHTLQPFDTTDTTGNARKPAGTDPIFKKFVVQLREATLGWR